MQLIVESVAVTLFRSVAQARRRAGARRSCCPTSSATKRATSGSACSICRSCWPSSARSKRTRLKLMQLKIVTLIGWGTHLKKRHFELLGIDNNDGFRRGFAPQPRGARRHALRRRRRAARRAGRRSARSTVINDRAIDLFFPRMGATVPAGSARSSASSTGSAASAIARCGWRHDRWHYTTFVTAGMFVVRMLHPRRSWRCYSYGRRRRYPAQPPTTQCR